TLANLATYQENLSASVSQIKDIDMAAEMVNFTKLQILQSAGTSMLAQANSSPQSVLKLLG
ncbi:MAG: flagellin, partial [Gaiellales bacterium]|nr:flagellin [Gaiellales bacterium]